MDPRKPNHHPPRRSSMPALNMHDLPLPEGPPLFVLPTSSPLAPAPAPALPASPPAPILNPCADFATFGWNHPALLGLFGQPPLNWSLPAAAPAAAATAPAPALAAAPLHVQAEAKRAVPRRPAARGTKRAAETSSETEGTDDAPASKGSRYQCAQCQKHFTRPSSLNTHMLTHTGEKPHACPFPGCNKHFSVRSNLRRHTRIHEHPRTRTRRPVGPQMPLAGQWLPFSPGAPWPPMLPHPLPVEFGLGGMLVPPPPGPNGHPPPAVFPRRFSAF